MVDQHRDAGATIERERADLLAGWLKAGGTEQEFAEHWPAMRLRILAERARILASPWNTPKGSAPCPD